MSLTTLNAYQRGGPVLDKLRSLWEGIRGRADDPSLGYVGASMLPGIGEATDLVEIGAGLQDRSLGRVGLGLAGLMIPFVGAAGVRKLLKGRRKLPMDEASVLRRIKDQEYDELLHGTKSKEELYRSGLEPRPFYQSDNPALAESYTPSFTKELSSVIDADNPSLGTVRAIREAINPQVVKVYSRAPNQLVFDAGDSSWLDIPIANVRRGIDPSRHKEFDAIVQRWRQHGPKGPVIATNDLDKVAKKMGYSGWDAHNLRDASYSSADRVGKAGPGYTPQDHPLFDYYRAGDAPSFVRSTLDPGNIRYEGARFDPSKMGIPDPLAGIAGLAGARYMSNALREDREN